jgi:hypothetical protein
MQSFPWVSCSTLSIDWNKLNYEAMLCNRKKLSLDYSFGGRIYDHSKDKHTAQINTAFLETIRCTP